MFLYLPFTKPSLSSHPPFSCKETHQFYAMEVFPPKLQLFITKKITASRSRGLLSFRASVILHRQLSEDVEVLTAVSDDFLHLLTIPSPNTGQRRFMQQLTLSGHELFCIVRVAQMFHQPHPNLPRIRLVLSNAYFAESDEATYFLVMLRVLASEGFDRDGVLSVFNDLFVQRCFSLCRDVISVDGLLFDWGQLELRLMPPGLVYGSLVLPTRLVR